MVNAVAALASDPFPFGIRNLRGIERSYRIQIGHYRVITIVRDNVLVIEIVRVRHRKFIYRR